MINYTNQEIIRSTKNSSIIKLAKLVSDKKHRDLDMLFIIEGEKLFAEAVKFNSVIKKLLIYEDFAVNINTDSRYAEIMELVEISRQRGAEIIIAGKEAFMKVSTEKSPQGIIAVLQYDEKNHRRIKSPRDDYIKDYTANNSGLLIALDAVRDPSNLGAVMRCASAFGFERMILVGNCADIYSSKTLRASMGALFKLKIDIFESISDAAGILKKSGRRIIAAKLDDSSAAADRNYFCRSDCVVIGNEGHGVSEQILSLCDDCVYIPIESKTESLNAAVAASIIMWEQSHSVNI